MGSAVARRLSEHGVRVRTSLKGRSEPTAKRAIEAGMIAADESDIAGVDIILSIVPPGEAVALAERLAALIARRDKKPVVVDCNAVNVDTVRRVEAIIASAGRGSSMPASSAFRRSRAARGRPSMRPVNTQMTSRFSRILASTCGSSTDRSVRRPR
jgi:NAD(P)-dependent dehydrogenase (short-subunit alcohol dehydrogenase family)